MKIQTLIASHRELLAMAILQNKSEPQHTIRGLQDAIAAGLAVRYPDTKTPVARQLDRAQRKAWEWEIAAQHMAYSIQNPTDTEAAWRAVLAFVSVNGSPTPKLRKIKRQVSAK